MSYIVEKRPPLLSGDGKWRFVYSDPSRYTRVHARYLASIKNLPPFWEIRLRQDNQVLETYVQPDPADVAAMKLAAATPDPDPPPDVDDIAPGEGWYDND